MILNTIHWAKMESKRNHRALFFVLIDMIINYLIYDVFPQEYFHYGYFKKTSADKRTYFTTKLYVRRRTELSDTKAEIEFFENKYNFANKFSSYYGRRYMKFDEATTFDDFLSFANSVNRFVYKPLTSCEGRGIKSYSVQDYISKEALYDDVRKRGGVALLDEWITQAEELSEIYPKGVNCIRVYTFIHDEIFEFIDAKFTVGLGSDIVNATLDNSIFCLVDVDTGIVTSDLCDYDLNVYSEHPITHWKPKGFQIPMWSEILDLCKKAAQVVPNVAYVGWDVALTKNGPVLIEGNHCGGCGGNQFCVLRKEKTGLKEKWDVMHRNQNS